MLSQNLNIPLNCILFTIMSVNCCTVSYQFWQKMFSSEAKALAYCLVFLDCLEIWLFPSVKQSELKPLMNGNMILLMSVMRKVKVKSSFVSLSSEPWTVVGKVAWFFFLKYMPTFLGCNWVDNWPVSAKICLGYNVFCALWRYGSLACKLVSLPLSYVLMSRIFLSC